MSHKREELQNGVVCTVPEYLVFGRAYGMAGDLKVPSLAMPDDTPLSFRTNLIAAISSSELGYIDGNFINASTTLRYGGSTEALTRLISKLSQYDGIQLRVTFVRETDGPAWTLKHNGWSQPGEIYIQVNVASTTINLDQLAITIKGHSEPRR